MFGNWKRRFALGQLITDVQWVSFGSKVSWKYDLSIQAYCKDLFDLVPRNEKLFKVIMELLCYGICLETP